MGGRNSLLMKPLTALGQATGFVEDKTMNADPALAAYGQQAAAGLAKSAAGTAPSISVMQYQQALADSAMQQQAMANASRGVNPALAQRNAANATAMAQADAAQQAAILQAEEQRRAQEILLGASESQRSQAQQARQASQGRLVGALTGLGQAAMTGGKTKGA